MFSQDGRQGPQADQLSRMRGRVQSVYAVHGHSVARGARLSGKPWISISLKCDAADGGSPPPPVAPGAAARLIAKHFSCALGRDSLPVGFRLIVAWFVWPAPVDSCNGCPTGVSVGDGKLVRSFAWWAPSDTAHPKIDVGERQTRDTRASHTLFAKNVGRPYCRSVFEEGAKPSTTLKRFAPEFLESEAILDQEYQMTIAVTTLERAYHEKRKTAFLDDSRCAKLEDTRSEENRHG